MEKLIHFFYIFFQGILFFQVGVFAYIYYSSRKMELLYYCFFLFFISINFFISDPSTFGLGDDEAVLNADWYKLVNTPLVISANIFYVLFLKGFYKTLTRNRLFFKILNTVKLVLIIFLILFLVLFAFGIHSNLFFNILNLLGTIVGIWLVIIIIKEKMPYTKFMALGFILNLIGTLFSVCMLVLLTQGVKHLLVSDYPFIFIKLGLLGELFFFNVAILKKWNHQEQTLLQKDLEKSLEMEKLRNEISKELHDDIGSTLSGIQMYSRLASEQSKSGLQQQSQKSLTTIKEASGEMIRSLKDMVWAIQPGDFTLAELAEKIKEHAQFMTGAKNIQLNMHTEVEPDYLIETEWRHHVFMIAKEIINNAVKYAQASNINIKIKKTNKEITLIITDDGIGFDTTMNSPGNGLNNLQERANEIGAELIIQSEIGIGTTVTIISLITT